MAYEDPNAPSPASNNQAQQSTAPVDQSKSFLGGQHHPWRRLFARTVDICTAGFLLFLILIFAFSATMPEQAAGFAKAIENPIVASVVLYLIWLPAEAVLLSLFGTTPAKLGTADRKSAPFLIAVAVGSCQQKAVDLCLSPRGVMWYIQRPLLVLITRKNLY